MLKYYVCANNLKHNEFKTEMFSRFTYTSIRDGFENEIKYIIKERIDAFNEYDEPYDYICNICGSETIDTQTCRVNQIITILENNLHQKRDLEVFTYIKYIYERIKYCLVENTICQYDYDFDTKNVDPIISLFSQYDLPVNVEWFYHIKGAKK